MRSLRSCLRALAARHACRTLQPRVDHSHASCSALPHLLTAPPLTHWHCPSARSYHASTPTKQQESSDEYAYSTDAAGSQHVDDLRKQLLARALSLVSQCGWTITTLHTAARQLGLSPAVVGVFPKCVRRHAHTKHTHYEACQPMGVLTEHAQQTHVYACCCLRYMLTDPSWPLCQRSSHSVTAPWCSNYNTRRALAS